MGTAVNVAIIGVGNCASAFVQGLHYYRDLQPLEPPPPGIMHSAIGPYAVSDVRVVAAFDVDINKVGRSVGEAIFTPPNNTIRFSHPPQHAFEVPVQRGMTHDSIGQYLADVVRKSPEHTVDVQRVLRDTETHVVINFLPVGSEEGTKWYIEQSLGAQCAVVNCIPVFIASQPYWQERFRNAGVPIIGDDIKSQVGATIVHRVLADLFKKRGVRLEHTMQLNVGGNTDFLNMLERSRLVSKKISKTSAVTSVVGHEMNPDDVHVGPSDHVPWLEDRKWAYIRLEGTTFGGVPLNLELKLEVWDSPNSAGVVIDAVRCAKLALDRGLSGALIEASACFCKSSPTQMDDHTAKENLEHWISP